MNQVVALFCALCLLFGLVACGDPTEATEPTDTETEVAALRFSSEGGAEAAAQLFAEEIYKQRCMAALGEGAIADYRNISWNVMEISADETVLVGWMEYALIPKENVDSSYWRAGNTEEGEGELEGWLVMGRQFVLEQQEDGDWLCTELGTGGYRLPEHEAEIGE